MRDLVLLLVQVLATLIRFLRPGGVRAIVGETLLLKHQLLIINRPRQRSRTPCLAICSSGLQLNVSVCRYRCVPTPRRPLARAILLAASPECRVAKHQGNPHMVYSWCQPGAKLS
jgi:hypothetical protein